MTLANWYLDLDDDLGLYVLVEDMDMANKVV